MFSKTSQVHSKQFCFLIPWSLIYTQHVYDFGNICDILRDQQCRINIKFGALPAQKKLKNLKTSVFHLWHWYFFFVLTHGTISWIYLYLSQNTQCIYRFLLMYLYTFFKCAFHYRVVWRDVHKLRKLIASTMAALWLNYCSLQLGLTVDGSIVRSTSTTSGHAVFTRVALL